MLKPLTQEQLDELLRTATSAFADRGFTGASINTIAKAAGISVGVVYKYYQGKEDLFIACVDRSLKYLDRVFEETLEKGGSLMEMIEDLIRQNQKAAREHPEYFKMYHQITVSGAPNRPDEVTELIEGQSARLYRKLLEQARDAGEVRQDMDPALFAFFFDNLMMMLHFSYACGYYEERMKIYCDDEGASGADDPEIRDREIRDQLMKFIGGAFAPPGPAEGGRS